MGWRWLAWCSVNLYFKPFSLTWWWATVICWGIYCALWRSMRFQAWQGLSSWNITQRFFFSSWNCDCTAIPRSLFLLHFPGYTWALLYRSWFPLLYKRFVLHFLLSKCPDDVHYWPMSLFYPHTHLAPSSLPKHTCTHTRSFFYCVDVSSTRKHVYLQDGCLLGLQQCPLNLEENSLSLVTVHVARLVCWLSFLEALSQRYDLFSHFVWSSGRGGEGWSCYAALGFLPLLFGWTILHGLSLYNGLIIFGLLSCLFLVAISRSCFLDAHLFLGPLSFR